MIILLKKPQVLISQACGKSTLHNRIRDGLFPPPVLTGARAVAWPSDEVEIVTNALIAGKPPETIRELVARLVKKRSERVMGGDV